MKKKKRGFLYTMKYVRIFFHRLLWPKPCAGGVCTRKKNGITEILCICHKNGKLMLPKGRCKKGETLEQTAIREFQEETGIYDFQLGEELGVTKNRQKGKKTTFFAIKKPGRQHIHFHDEATLWVKIEDALVDMRHKGERKLLKEYIEDVKR